ILNIIEIVGDRSQNEDGGSLPLLRRLFVLCLLLAVAGVAFLAWSGDTSLFHARDLKTLGAGLEDAKTTAAVKAAVSLNRGLRPHGLAGSTGRGVGSVPATVPDAALRAAAERVAASVPDVRQVVNHIEVSPAAARAVPADRTLGETVDDRSLEVQVRLALSLNRELRNADIRVQAY